jgi:hypothetical protein
VERPNEEAGAGMNQWLVLEDCADACEDDADTIEAVVMKKGLSQK